MNTEAHKTEMWRRKMERDARTPTYTDHKAIREGDKLREIRARTHNFKGEIQR